MPDPSPSGSRLVAEIAEAERAERTRLADRLHDEGLQLVLAARQELEELRDGDPAALDALADDLARATEALRSLTAAMHEDVLTHLPLAESLRRIGSDAARRGRFALAIAVEAPAAGVHDDMVRDVARELLANVARHAQATQVELEVQGGGAELLVRVSDDGRGVDARARVAAERSGHLGLRRLERTLGELGGRFALDQRAGGGTVASAWLPRRVLAAQSTLEDELRDARRWTSALMAAQQDGLVVFRDHRTVQVNDAFCRLTGFGRDVLLDRTPADYPFWPEEDRDELLAGMEEAYARGGLDQVVELRHAEGWRLPVLASSARIDDAGADRLTLVMTIKDLSAERRAEERRRLAVELETTIETTRRLTAILTAIQAGVPAVLDALGRLLVDHLGWGNVVVNLRADGDDGWVVAWTSARELADALGHDVQRDLTWAPYLDARFARRGAWFVPAGVLPHDELTTHVPPWVPLSAPDAWLADDMLIVPLQSRGSAPCGMVSVDCPRSGLRPTDTELDALVAAGEHAAGALALGRGDAG